MHVHADPRDGKEHLALVKGDVAGQEGVLTRVHSECFTGDVLGSLRCDCGWQLTRAMRCIAREGRGVVVYLRQEGRGIGLAEKLRAYNLQDAGHDTVDANLLLGHDADSRDYTGAADILKELGVRSVRLLTNNPHKIEGLERAGLPVAARIPLPPRFTAENTAYLLTKATRMRHLLSLANVAGTGEHDAGRRQPRRRRRAGAAEGERPLVTVSYAQSLDGCISACRGKPLQLSGPEALVMTHELRAAHDGILVGIGTVLADNPRLTVRLVKGKDPQPIVVDTRLRFPLEANLLGRGSPGPWIAAGVDADPGREAALEACGARVLRLPLTPAGEVNLAALLRVLGGLGMRSLLVEGGARIITSFLASGLADRLVVTVAPALVGGLHGIESREWAGQQQLPELTCVRAQKLGKDVVVSGDLVRRL